MAKPKHEDEPSKGELMIPNGGAVATADLTEYGDLEGAGRAKADELLIPFLTILQTNSPQVDRNDPKHVEGAEPGMIFNTATKECYEKFIGCVVGTDHNYVEYTPRDKGGGFQGMYAPDSQFIQDLLKDQKPFGKLIAKGGETEVIESYYEYLIAKVAANVPTIRAVVGFKSTQIKLFKQHRTIMDGLTYTVEGRLIRPPSWAHAFMYSSKPDSNKKGKFFSWKIELVGGVKERAFIRKTDPIFQEAVTMFEGMKTGMVKADMAASAAAGDEPGDPEAPPLA